MTCCCRSLGMNLEHNGVGVGDGGAGRGFWRRSGAAVPVAEWGRWCQTPKPRHDTMGIAIGQWVLGRD